MARSFCAEEINEVGDFSVRQMFDDSLSCVSGVATLTITKVTTE